MLSGPVISKRSSHLKHSTWRIKEICSLWSEVCYEVILAEADSVLHRAQELVASGCLSWMSVGLAPVPISAFKGVLKQEIGALVFDGQSQRLPQHRFIGGQICRKKLCPLSTQRPQTHTTCTTAHSNIHSSLWKMRVWLPDCCGHWARKEGLCMNVSGRDVKLPPGHICLWSNFLYNSSSEELAFNTATSWVLTDHKPVL